MRADRLVAAFLLLQARGRLTAAELAEELEVSLKTARRDLESLSAAGLPVYAQPGRGGGWQLLGGGRTDLSGLNAAETRALFLLAGPHTRLAPEARSALRKLVRALPEPFREHATAAAEAVVLDPAGWGGAPPPASPHLEALQRAVVERVQVRLRYAGRSGAVTTRTVHPLGVAAKGGTWYLLAETASGRRTFRVDRVRGVAPTERPAIRPPGFELAQAWREAVAEVDAGRTRAQAVVLTSPAAAAGLLFQFGGDARVGARRPDGRLDVHIGGASTLQLAERLAGWGNVIEVAGPLELRRQLAEIGAQLVEAYADHEAVVASTGPSRAATSPAARRR
jgi:predicted DNA-binding transcriptional regulator YafY